MFIRHITARNPSHLIAYSSNLTGNHQLSQNQCVPSFYFFIGKFNLIPNGREELPKWQAGLWYLVDSSTDRIKTPLMQFYEMVIKRLPLGIKIFYNEKPLIWFKIYDIGKERKNDTPLFSLSQIQISDWLCVELNSPGCVEGLV